MLLNVHGLSAEMVANVLQRYPTPRALAEALDAHGRACALRGLPTEQAGWLLEEVLVPLTPLVADKLGEDAELFELAALVSDPGAPRQPAQLRLLGHLLRTREWGRG